MAQVNFRIDDQMKSEAEELFSALGLNMSTAITIFIKQSLNRRGLPFEVSEDPFFHPANIAYLERAAADYENGAKNYHVHELIDPDAEVTRMRTSRRIRRAKALA